jgi:hypothetical protein
MLMLLIFRIVNDFLCLAGLTTLSRQEPLSDRETQRLYRRKCVNLLLLKQNYGYWKRSQETVQANQQSFEQQ